MTQQRDYKPDTHENNIDKYSLHGILNLSLLYVQQTSRRGCHEPSSAYFFRGGINIKAAVSRRPYCVGPDKPAQLRNFKCINRLLVHCVVTVVPQLCRPSPARSGNDTGSGDALKTIHGHVLYSATKKRYDQKSYESDLIIY